MQPPPPLLLPNLYSTCSCRFNHTVQVNGRFQCIGSPQHLKTRFGRGYSITARVPGGASADTMPLKRFLNQHVPDSLIKEEHQVCATEGICFSNMRFFFPPLHLLCVVVPSSFSSFHSQFFPELFTLSFCVQGYVKFATGAGVGCARLFELMEDAKANLGLEDYSVSQTTLEQVRCLYLNSSISWCHRCLLFIANNHGLACSISQTLAAQSKSHYPSSPKTRCSWTLPSIRSKTPVRGSRRPSPTASD